MSLPQAEKNKYIHVHRYQEILQNVQFVITMSGIEKLPTCICDLLSEMLQNAPGPGLLTANLSVELCSWKVFYLP